MEKQLGVQSKAVADRMSHGSGSIDAASLELAGSAARAFALDETDAFAQRSRLAVLLEVEFALVRHIVRTGRHPWIRPFALTLNHFGNGWLYPLLAMVLWWQYPARFTALVSASAVAALTAHAIYPWIKRRVARIRPFEVDPTLTPMLRALDRYSFPSGHCMTITAVVIPICWTMPTLTLPAVLGCALVAWARMAAAHHYPTDIVAGIALGAVTALPVVLFLP